MQVISVKINFFYKKTRKYLCISKKNCNFARFFAGWVNSALVKSAILIIYLGGYSYSNSAKCPTGSSWWPCRKRDAESYQ